MLRALMATLDSVAPITLSSNWIDVSGASPQTTATRTLTVPAGNPGQIRFNVSATIAGVTRYSKNGGAFTNFVDSDTLSVADTDTLALRLVGAGTDASITVTDTATGASVGDVDILCDP